MSIASIPKKNLEVKGRKNNFVLKFREVAQGTSSRVATYTRMGTRPSGKGTFAFL